MGLKTSFEGQKRHFVSIKDEGFILCVERLNFVDARILVVNLSDSRFAGLKT